MTEREPQMAWRPVAAVLANPLARRAFAELVLAEGGDRPAPLASLESSSPSRARHVESLLLKAGVARRDAEDRLVLDAAVFSELLKSDVKPRDRGIERFLTGDGMIAAYPANKKERGLLLALVVDRSIRESEVLDERELNQRLSTFTTDPATLRRYLVDYSLLERTRSGSHYARPEPS